MRNDDASEASFSEPEEIAGAVSAEREVHAPPASEASAPSTQRPAKRRHNILGILSYILSALVVVGAFTLLLAAGLTGRIYSLAKGDGSQTSVTAGAPAQTKLASAQPAAEAPAVVPNAVPVLTSVSEKRPAPITTDAVGRVESIAAITVRTRVDGQIAKVLFQDGQAVNQGDVLYELDARQIDSQIRQGEAIAAKDRAQIVQAKRDFVRNDTLAKTNAGSILNLQNAQTAEALAEAALEADEAALENLKVQRSYYTITSPVTGRVGIGIQREGSAIRTGDSSGTLVTVNQIKPIYVNFALPQKLFSTLQSASGRGGATVVATVQGSAVSTEGRVTAIDNSADPTSGNIGVRASFDNAEEALWPGLLCNVTVTLGRDEEAVVIPRDAVQSSQDGTIVYVIERGVAKVKRVKVDRFEGGSAIISEGLSGGETVVTDGQLRLVDGTPVSTSPDQRRPGGHT